MRGGGRKGIGEDRRREGEERERRVKERGRERDKERVTLVLIITRANFPLRGAVDHPPPPPLGVNTSISARLVSTVGAYQSAKRRGLKRHLLSMAAFWQGLNFFLKPRVGLPPPRTPRVSEGLRGGKPAICHGPLLDFPGLVASAFCHFDFFLGLGGGRGREVALLPSLSPTSPVHGSPPAPGSPAESGRSGEVTGVRGLKKKPFFFNRPNSSHVAKGPKRGVLRGTSLLLFPQPPR